MIFELWAYHDGRAHCVGRSTQEQVRLEYHDMEVGDKREIALCGDYIVRVK